MPVCLRKGVSGITSYFRHYTDKLLLCLFSVPWLACKLYNRGVWGSIRAAPAVGITDTQKTQRALENIQYTRAHENQ
jgi:hypothetical protein